jgi:hypothetical protein
VNLAFLKAGAVAVASGGCSARSSAQRELVTSGLYTTLADSTPAAKLAAKPVDIDRPVVTLVAKGTLGRR